MMAASWQDYLKLLESLTKTISDLTAVEQDKTAAVVKADLAAVEACMKREQALSMALRGLDQKRDRMLAELNMKGVPLRSIMDRCPPGYEDETRRVSEELRGKYRVFQAASQVARDTLECNLRVIERARAGEDGEPPQDIPISQSDFRA